MYFYLFVSARALSSPLSFGKGKLANEYFQQGL
jgi:hypothetical protein